MKKTDLKKALAQVGAWGLERVTRFDGDAGVWRVVDEDLCPVPAPDHPNQILHVLRDELEPVFHPRWQREEAFLLEKLKQALDVGGGYRHALADRVLSACAEGAGENLLRIKK